MAILGALGMFLFRPQIRDLLSRTKKVGKGGLETYEQSQVPAQRETSEGMQGFLKAFDNPLLTEQEQVIDADIQQRGLQTAEEIKRALVRSLAGTQIILHFEQVFTQVWASQISLLNFLNLQSAPVDLGVAEGFYEQGEKGFPALYEHYTFEQYLMFLTSNNMIVLDNEQIAISVAGREFLKYLLDTGKAGPYHG